MISTLLSKMQNSDELNAIGLLSTSLAFVNSFFQMFNPVFTGIFYIASIGWLGVQIYYKIKNKGK